jgi:hypothetical protein
LGTKECSKVVCIYANDLLIFSDDNEKLNTLVDATVEFINFPRININPEKSKLIIYNPTDIIVPELTVPNDKNE